MNKKYKKRWLAEVIRETIDVTPVIVLTGARQVGKSTMLLNESPFSQWQYYDLDDLDARAMAEKSPQALLEGDFIVIDEAQKVPELLNTIKVAVDRYPKKKILLSGSANLLLMKRVTESLAGRASYFVLRPMTFGEMNDAPPSSTISSLLGASTTFNLSCKDRKDDLVFLMWRGMLPPLIFFDKVEHIFRWWNGYVLTYLERDLRELSSVSSLVDFRRVMERLAFSTGSLLNETEVAKDTGVSQPTVHRYINLLEVSHVITRVPGYFKSRTKRIVKRAKLYYLDSGLLSHLMGFYSPKDLKNSKYFGVVFETFVLHHLQVILDLLPIPGRIYHWRTVDGREVDFVIEWRQHLLPVEVKAKESVSYSDFENIQLFMKEYPVARAGVVVYAGNDLKTFGSKLIAIPWFCL